MWDVHTVQELACVAQSEALILDLSTSQLTITSDTEDEAGPTQATPIGKENIFSSDEETDGYATTDSQI